MSIMTQIYMSIIYFPNKFQNIINLAMIHHGKNLQKIANERGLNKSQIAKMLGKTSQSVDYDFKREVLNIETLKKYSQALEISLDKIQIESKEIPSDYMVKYYKAIEELNYLKGVLLKNGIRVDLPNFNPGVSVSVLGNMNQSLFFDK